MKGVFSLKGSIESEEKSVNYLESAKDLSERILPTLMAQLHGHACRFSFCEKVYYMQMRIFKQLHKASHLSGRFRGISVLEMILQRSGGGSLSRQPS